jgi:hypothetical protein
MADTLLVSFAEIEFLVRAQPERAGSIRRALGVRPEAGSDVVAAAGLAGLLARGLCTEADGVVMPATPLLALAAALLEDRGHVELVGWSGPRPVALHLFGGPAARVALSQGGYGLFSAELLRADEPLAATVMRVVDAFAEGGGEAAVAVRWSTQDGELDVAIAREGSGDWYLSDTLLSPERGVPSTRDGVAERLEQLLTARPARALS